MIVRVSQVTKLQAPRNTKPNSSITHEIILFTYMFLICRPHVIADNANWGELWSDAVPLSCTQHVLETVARQSEAGNPIGLRRWHALLIAWFSGGDLEILDNDSIVMLLSSSRSVDSLVGGVLITECASIEFVLFESIEFLECLTDMELHCQPSDVNVFVSLWWTSCCRTINLWYDVAGRVSRKSHHWT
jgi:hypothetical protein